MREIRAIVNTNLEVSKNIILKGVPFIIKIAKDIRLNANFPQGKKPKDKKLKLYLSCHKTTY